MPRFPPLDLITASNRQVFESLSAEDEIGSFEVLPDLTVVIYLKETSPFEPYVVFVPAADRGRIHVIVNGLHPYYQTLEAKDAIYECVQQFMYDAVAEFKGTQLITTPIAPTTVRKLKDQLLRAQADKLDNADASVRAKAEAELFGTRASGPGA